MKDIKFEVALCKEICPLCGSLQDGPLLMNTSFSTRQAEQVKALDGKVIGIMPEPCKSCKTMMSQGFLLIGVIEEKTTDRKNPYRSGHIWVVRLEQAVKVFGEKATNAGAGFIDVKIAEKLHLPMDVDKQTDQSSD